MSQIWMPELSICNSLSALDDVQLKTTTNYAVRLFKMSTSCPEEMDSIEPIYKIMLSKSLPTQTLTRYKMFLKAYIDFAKEELQYRFSNREIVQTDVEIPKIYHIVYHGPMRSLYSAQPCTKLDGPILPLNFLMREALCKHWTSCKLEPIWTNREKPKWFVTERKVSETKFGWFDGGIHYLYNKDGTLSPRDIPYMIYKKTQDNFIKFIGVNLK